MATEDTITISMDDAAALLGYLDDAANGMSEYGADAEDFDELDALKRRLHFLVFGEELPPPPKPEPPSPERMAELDALAHWMNTLKIPAQTFVSKIVMGDASETSGTFEWGYAKPPSD